jgi:uncharacterized membrane protein
MDNVRKARRARRDSTVLYATLKAFHLLAVIVWVGGMAFTLFCLRPAARVLEPPARIALMHAAMRRFLAVVAVAIAVIFVCGVAMVAIAWSAAARAGLRFNMPLDWYVMFAVFFVMLAVFVHIRSVLFGRLDAALREQRWATAQRRSARSAGRCRRTSSRRLRDRAGAPRRHRLRTLSAPRARRRSRAAPRRRARA